MKTLRILLAICLIATLFGCTQEEQAAGTGAIIGAGVGAIIGHQSGETAEGAALGAAVGGLAGYGYGKMQQRQTEDGDVEKYVKCPKCETTLMLPAEADAGDQIRCANCGTQFKLQ